VGGKMDKLSIVIPCLNEEESLPYLYKSLDKLSEQMCGQDFEFIFIDDGSNDKSLEYIIEVSKKDTRVKYISFTRNFGKEAAILAGMKSSSGNYTILLDADMQDPPNLIDEMYKSIINEDYDCIAARRINRKGEPKLRSFFAKFFYKTINKISETQIIDGARDFRIMSRQMVDAVISLNEYNRFSKGIFSWVGFKTKWVEYENIERVAGSTKWSNLKLIRYSLDGIISFSSVPLSLMSITGIVLCLISIVIIMIIITKTILYGDDVQGWPSLACIIIFIGGIQLLCTGILGQYLSRIYMETKRRPLYLEKQNNITDYLTGNGDNVI
jgi:glycosyltransferase involved in cell wall biosynthesis